MNEPEKSPSVKIACVVMIFTVITMLVTAVSTPTFRNDANSITQENTANTIILKDFPSIKAQLDIKNNYPNNLGLKKIKTTLVGADCQEEGKKITLDNPDEYFSTDADMIDPNIKSETYLQSVNQIELKENQKVKIQITITKKKNPPHNRCQFHIDISIQTALAQFGEIQSKAEFTYEGITSTQAFNQEKNSFAEKYLQNVLQFMQPSLIAQHVVGAKPTCTANACYSNVKQIDIRPEKTNPFEIKYEFSDKFNYLVDYYRIDIPKDDPRYIYGSPKGTISVYLKPIAANSKGKIRIYFDKPTNGYNSRIEVLDGNGKKIEVLLSDHLNEITETPEKTTDLLDMGGHKTELTTYYGIVKKGTSIPINLFFFTASKAQRDQLSIYYMFKSEVTRMLHQIEISSPNAYLNPRFFLNCPEGYHVIPGTFGCSSDTVKISITPGPDSTPKNTDRLYWTASSRKEPSPKHLYAAVSKVGYIDSKKEPTMIQTQEKISIMFELKKLDHSDITLSITPTLHKLDPLKTYDFLTERDSFLTTIEAYSFSTESLIKKQGNWILQWNGALRNGKKYADYLEGKITSANQLKQRQEYLQKAEQKIFHQEINEETIEKSVLNLRQTKSTEYSFIIEDETFNNVFDLFTRPKIWKGPLQNDPTYFSDRQN